MEDEWALCGLVGAWVRAEWPGAILLEFGAGLLLDRIAIVKRKLRGGQGI